MTFETFSNYVIEVYGDEKDYLSKFALKQVIREMKPIYSKLRRTNKTK
jgi:hypothetical protein